MIVRDPLKKRFVARVDGKKLDVTIAYRHDEDGMGIELKFHDANEHVQSAVIKQLSAPIDGKEPLFSENGFREGELGSVDAILLNFHRPEYEASQHYERMKDVEKLMTAKHFSKEVDLTEKHDKAKKQKKAATEEAMIEAATKKVEEK